MLIARFKRDCAPIETEPRLSARLFFLELIELSDRACQSKRLGIQENCKVGVWSIFRPTGYVLTEQSLAENMDLTPSPRTLQFSWLGIDQAPNLEPWMVVALSGSRFCTVPYKWPKIAHFLAQFCRCSHFGM